MARSFKFWVYEDQLEGMYNLCSQKKSADQLYGYHTADLHLCFRIYAKSKYSHDVAQITGVKKLKLGETQNYLSLTGERGGLVVNASDSGSRGRGLEPTRVKAHLLPKSTGNTQEAMALSQHD